MAASMSYMKGVLQCVAVYCGVSQRVAVCCSVLQRRRGTFSLAGSDGCIYVLHERFVAVCCSVLRCVCCSGGEAPISSLDQIAASMSYMKGVLQCVAVCCSVLQRRRGTCSLP